jgi:hypothetical protein
MHSEPIPSFTHLPRDLPVAAGDASSARRLGERSRRVEEAMRLMEEGCWHTSFMVLSELADEGHRQSARIALLFVQRGTVLFGGSFRASSRQRAGWQRASA